MNSWLDERIIADIASIAGRYSVSRILLFGSRARGDNTPLSDIDLAVYPDSKSWSLRELAHFSNEIDELETLLKIDLVIVNERLDPELLEAINNEGVLIYERFAQKAE